MKISELVQARAILLNKRSTNFPIKTGYCIAKFLRDTDKDAEFYQTKYQEIVMSYSEKDENGNPIQIENSSAIRIRQDLVEDCIQALKELDELEIENHILVLPLENLEGFTPEEIYTLMPYIEE